MQHDSDLFWTDGTDQITISPRDGGRIISWIHAGQERVHPVVHFEGGLFRILFAEEQYPGSSYVVPHQVVEWHSTASGFRIHLRHYWNSPAWFMRAADWSGKANEFHIDGLLLDKILTFDRERNCLVCDITITNLSDEIKYLTPWLHSSFAPWPSERWIVVDGLRQEFCDTDIYWGAHLVPLGIIATIVQADVRSTLFAVTGTATEHVRGLCGMLPVSGEFLQATSELRGASIEIAPGDCYRANSFLALTGDWQSISRQPPVALHSEIEPGTESVSPPQLTDLLQAWMLPDEEQRGLMVLSYLDKPPFYTDSRYSAAHSFAGFRAIDSEAQSHVMLYASRDLAGSTAEIGSGDGKWHLRFGEQATSSKLVLDLQAHDYRPLTLIGPADLGGKADIRVKLTLSNGDALTLEVDTQARLEEQRPYQMRQAPAYMELRYRDKLGPASGSSADEITEWQLKTRARLRQWLAFNAYDHCDLDPRLVERQEGPTCIREKWLVQTEPGIHVPGYLVRPKNVTGRLPLIYFLHGSGPGKDGFAGDELQHTNRTMFGHELENLPYGLAQQLGCLVYVPDGRGQGELGETDPGRWSARLNALGISNAALRLRDQIRALDWLVQRDDVDAERIGSCGCSGGGQLTYMFAAADERIAASIVSSTTILRSPQPAPPGWFHRMLLEPGTRIEPYGIEPIGGAPMGMLIAPRPIWIVDGLDDLGIPEDKRAEWRGAMQQGRDAIRQVYKGLNAEDKILDSWLEGGHCAGMTHVGVAAWFRKWFADGS